MNLVGVLVGGIWVTFALVAILPPNNLTPPDGSAAVSMLVLIFSSALVWNVLTRYFSIPNRPLRDRIVDRRSGHRCARFDLACHAARDDRVGRRVVLSASLIF
jgi:hypothetical protein